MRVKLYREYGAGNSGPVFDAFEKGVIANGDECVDNFDSADVIVIWSVLFAGRMAGNKDAYQRARLSGKPIVVLEVGNLIRGETWRVGLNGINRTADWGSGDIDPNRYEKFGVELKPWSPVEGGYITICTQRGDSLQWEGKPVVEDWCLEQIREVRKYSDRAIVIRPHPRSNDQLQNLFKSAEVLSDKIYFDVPQQTGRDQVNFEDALRYSHAVINHSAGPGVQAAIAGIPVVVSDESLAWDVSSKIEEIEFVRTPDRTEWINNLAHTEYFVDEIEAGLPWSRLKNSLS